MRSFVFHNQVVPSGGVSQFYCWKWHQNLNSKLPFKRVFLVTSVGCELRVVFRSHKNISHFHISLSQIQNMALKKLIWTEEIEARPLQTPDHRSTQHNIVSIRSACLSFLQWLLLYKPQHHTIIPEGGSQNRRGYIWGRVTNNNKSGASKVWKSLVTIYIRWWNIIVCVLKCSSLGCCELRRKKLGMNVLVNFERRSFFLNVATFQNVVGALIFCVDNLNKVCRRNPLYIVYYINNNLIHSLILDW